MESEERSTHSVKGRKNFPFSFQHDAAETALELFAYSPRERRSRRTAARVNAGFNVRLCLGHVGNDFQ